MKVFVYGTLKRDRGNHGCFYPYDSSSEPTFLGEAVTKDSFVMTTCGFPYVIHPDFVPTMEALPIRGELFEIDENILDSLDCLEGFRTEGDPWNHYNREEQTVITEDGEEHSCYMYISNSDSDCREGGLPLCGTEEYREKKVYVF